MYRDLQTFIDALDAAGELVRISDPVSPTLEIAAITDRVSKSKAPNDPTPSARRTDPAFFNRGGPAILFERVEGSDTPVLINAFGSYRRMEMALGCDTDGKRKGGFAGIARTIGELSKPQPPRGLGEAFEKARQFAPLLKIGPKRMKRAGACQEVVEEGDDIDLTRLPILRCWPLDGDYEAVGYPAGVNDGVPGMGHPEISDERWDAEFRGRYITLAGIHTIHADDIDDSKPASHNIGMYRVQLLGKDRVAMHWHMHHDGARHWRSWKKRGEDMPVAIVLGGPSVLPYAATAPLPPGISELLMAGFLNGSGMRMCRAKTVPLWVPADAEMVIEGYVSADAGFIDWDPRDPGAGDLGPNAVFEGPFGDHTGFYSMPDRYPVVRVTAVTRRKNAVYPTTIVGLPPQEDYYLGKATERLFLPLLQVLIPDIEDYDLPMFGAFHNCAAVQIKKSYQLQGRRVMHSVWGAGQMAWTKSIFVVDHETDVHDTRAVMEAAAKWCRPSRDIEIVHGPLDILDHAAPRLGAGVKIGFDCTRKIEGEQVRGVPIDGVARSLPSGERLEEMIEAVRTVDGVLDAAINEDAAPGWLLVRVDRDFGEPERAGLGRRALIGAMERLAAFGESAPPFVVVVGRSVDLGDPVLPLFHWLANSDPGRDAVPGTAFGFDAMGFDASAKTEEDSEHGPDPVRAWPPILEMDAGVDESDRVRSILDRLGVD